MRDALLPVETMKGIHIIQKLKKNDYGITQGGFKKPVSLSFSTVIKPMNLSLKEVDKYCWQ